MTAAQATPAETLATLLHKRHSCRAFLPRPVPRETVERILDIAQRTASWCNAQPWQVHLLSGAATERARAHLPNHVSTRDPGPDLPWPEAYVGVYNERRRECGWQLYTAVGVSRGDQAASLRQRMENFRFFGAPHVALITSDAALGTYAAIDCGAYVGNFMLAAQSVGVATVAQAALASHPEFWREQLGLAADRRVVCGISFGYEDTQHPANAFRTNRAATAQAVTWVD